MMKLLLLGLFLIQSFLLLSQTNFSLGFEEGYKEGYCYNVFGCITPIPPIAPIPKIGESYNSYQDGYNRGFLLGQNVQQTQNSDRNSSIQQTQNPDRNSSRGNNSATYQVQSTFVPYDLVAMQQVLNNAQEKRDKDMEYIYEMQNWILNLKSQTNDYDFLKTMDSCYSVLEKEPKYNSILEPLIIKIEKKINIAISTYNKKISNPNTYWDIALEQFEQEDYTNSIINFGHVIELASNFAGAYFYRGYIYYLKNDYNLAIQDFDICIQLEPNKSAAYTYRGWAKYNVEDYYGAVKDFNNQISLENSAKAFYNRGTAKNALKDYYGAISDYEKAIELAPNFSMAYNNLAWSKFELKEYSEALIYVNKAIILDSLNYVAYDSRAEIQFNLKNYTNSIADCNIAVRLNPNMANSYFIKGRDHYRLGNKQKACESWSKAGELGMEKAYEYISKYCQ